MPFTSSRLWAAMVAVTGALLANTVNAAEQRIALVIGNAAYAGIQSLQNPLNDAAEVEKEHPDVVIQEIVGRHLYNFIPSPELVPRSRE